MDVIMVLCPLRPSATSLRLIGRFRTTSRRHDGGCGYVDGRNLLSAELEEAT